MSSDTAPFTSRSASGAVLTIACAGFCTAALQTAYFRELLTVFRGNELSIGIIFSVWLLSTGAATALAGAWAARQPSFAAGSLLSAPQRGWIRLPVLLVLLSVFAATGFISIRLCRLATGSGIAIGPIGMLCVTAAATVPFTFVNGLLLGVLFSRGETPGVLYGAENAGAVVGALCVFVCIMLSAANSTIAAVSLVPILLALGKRWRAAAVILCCIAGMLVLDSATVQWKYPGIPVSRIVPGHEAEIVFVATGKDTTLLINGATYRSTIEKPMAEQAVHIPMAQRVRAAAALVVFDRGQSAELSKYPALSVDILETEPSFATRGGRARVAAVETYHTDRRYDVVLLGTALPNTAASNRFYTRSFFLKIKSLMTDSGIVSFSLAFSENYLSRNEQKLYNSLLSTLYDVWKNVAVFPGEGYTFMASDGPCTAEPPPKLSVPTQYLASSIIPGVSDERIQNANKRPALPMVNTRDKPITLLVGLQTWLDQYGNGIWSVIALFVAAAAAVVILLPKNQGSLSIGTSGFAAGMYSVCLLILFQATYGVLYSRVSLLLVSLTAGFAIGSFVKKFPYSDFFIGLYAVSSLFVLALFPFPPEFLFYLFHAGIGIVTGAQFATRAACSARGKAAPASLYAADLLGGAIGMAVCSTLLVPLVGIMPVAGGLFVIKTAAEVLCGRFGRSLRSAPPGQ
jgi:hypothetical protein